MSEKGVPESIGEAVTNSTAAISIDPAPVKAAEEQSHPQGAVESGLRITNELGETVEGKSLEGVPSGTTTKKQREIGDYKAGAADLPAVSEGALDTAPPASAAAVEEQTTESGPGPKESEEAKERDGEEPQRLSKKAIKRQARLAKFQATRVEWKAAKKEKQKELKARKREEKLQEIEELKKKRKAEGMDDKEIEKLLAKKPRIERAEPTLHPLTIVLDCGFDELMTDKEITSMSSQLTRAYSDNRKSDHQAMLEVTSFNGRLRDRFDKTLNNQHLKWKNISFSESEYEVPEAEKNDNGRLIYLTADSDNTITTLEDGHKYIVGGIVDRNRHKFLCFDKAKEQGIRHAKLPIGDYIQMSSRYVLTTNQVVEIMLKWLEVRDWEKAFLHVIPPRKAPQARAEWKDSEDGDEEDPGERMDWVDRDEEKAEERQRAKEQQELMDLEADEDPSSDPVLPEDLVLERSTRATPDSTV